MDFPSQHWLKIRTNNVIERMNREIRRRTRVVGTFPDGKFASKTESDALIESRKNIKEVTWTTYTLDPDKIPAKG